MKAKTIIISVLVITSLVGVFYWLKNHDKLQSPSASYQVEFDQLSPDSAEISIIIYRKDLTTNIIDHYVSIGAEDFYLYFIKKFPDKDKLIGDIAQFSMSQTYVEGLSSDNKFLTGKLIDPTNKKQIGHWTYDLDKKEFSEMLLNLPN